MDYSQSLFHLESTPLNLEATMESPSVSARWNMLPVSLLVSISPISHFLAFSSHIDHVQRFVRKLTDIMRIVESTVAAKLKFSELKDDFPSLVLLPIRNWAGIGAVW